MVDVKIVIRTIDEAKAGVVAINREMDNLKKSAAGGGGALQTLNSDLKKVAATMVGVGAAGLVIKKALDFAKEGAAINQVTDSFDRMNESVYQTPDLLNRMSEAARGTISEFDLMRGLLTLTAGTTEEMGKSFADAAPQLLEIAKAANKLNPTLGDTAFLYDSISRGIKRSSPLILDNLGIVVKVGEANEKYAASIGKTVQELTAEDKQMALLNETLVAGDRLIQQVGGNVDSQTDAWARLETKVKENQDALKQAMSDAMLPIVEALGNMDETATEARLSLEKLSKVGSDLGDLSEKIEELDENLANLLSFTRQNSEGLDILRGTIDGLIDPVGAFAKGVVDFGEAAINTIADADSLASVLSADLVPGVVGVMIAVQEGSIEVLKMAKDFPILGGAVQDFIGIIKNNIDWWKDYIGVTDDGSDAMAAADMRAAAMTAAFQKLYGVTEDTAKSIGRVVDKSDAVARSHAAAATRIYQNSAAYGEFQDKLAQANSHLSDSEAFTLKANQAMGLHKEVVEDVTRSYEALSEQMRASTGDFFTAALNAEAGAGFFNEALSDLGQTTYYVSNLTQDQKGDLELLTDAYDKAADKLHSYELGIGTTGMEQDALNEKMEEQRAIMADLAPTIAQLESVGGQYATTLTEATINQDAVNQALFDAVDAAGGSAAQLAILGGELGLYSEDAVAAALQSSILQEAINTMAAEFAKPGSTLSIDQMQEALDRLITRLENPPPPLVLETNITEAMEGLSEADAKLAEKLGVFTEESQGMATDAQTAFGDIRAAALENMPGFETAVDEALLGAAQSAETNMAAIQAAVSDNLSGALTTAEGYPPQFGAVGTNIGQTMAAKLLAEGGALSNAAAQIVAAALAAAEEAAEVGSPSKRAMRLADDIVEGLITQLLAGQVDLEKISGWLIGGVFDEIKDGIVVGEVDVQEALKSVIDGMFDTVQDSLSAGSTFGRLSQFFADMLFPDNSEAVTAVEDRIADAFGGQLPDLEKNFDELLGYAKSTGQSQLIRDLEEYRRLQDERNAAEQKMLEIQKQQQQLGFLQSQLDLLQMIQNAGLNPAEVLAGIELGLGADIEDLLAASQAAMNAMIAQAQGQLGGVQTILLGGMAGTIGGPGGISTMGFGNGAIGPGGMPTIGMGGAIMAGAPVGSPAGNGGQSFGDINIYVTAPNSGNPYLFGRAVADQVALRLGVRG